MEGQTFPTAPTPLLHVQMFALAFGSTQIPLIKLKPVLHDKQYSKPVCGQIPVPTAGFPFEHEQTGSEGSMQMPFDNENPV